MEFSPSTSSISCAFFVFFVFAKGTLNTSSLLESLSFAIVGCKKKGRCLNPNCIRYINIFLASALVFDTCAPLAFLFVVTWLTTFEEDSDDAPLRRDLPRMTPLHQ